MNTGVRRGTRADVEALSAFMAKTFDDTFGPDNRPEDMRAHLGKAYGIAQQSKELADPDVVTLVVERDGALIAYAQVRRNTPPPCVKHESPVELHRIYVDKPGHGAGIAQQLMDECKNVGRELGGAHLWLCVWEHNPRAQAFYAKMGFTDVGSTFFYVGPDRQTDRVLVARIAPAG